MLDLNYGSNIHSFRKERKRKRDKIKSFSFFYSLSYSYTLSLSPSPSPSHSPTLSLSHSLSHSSRNIFILMLLSQRIYAHSTHCSYMDAHHIRTVRKSGNSKVVTIPPEFTCLQIGDQVWVERRGDQVLITKVERK